MMRRIKNKKTFCLLFLLMVFGFLYRYRGLRENYSFWIDEASSAAFARAILEIGRPVLSTGYAAGDYIFHFYLMAASFKIFGLTEFAARFPSVLFGVFLIPLVFFLGRHFADEKTGLVAAFLTTFSVLEITYSRQARAYQEVQFFFILTLFAFVALLEAYERNELKIRNFLFLFLAFGLSALTHKFGLLFFVEVIVYLLLIRNDLLKRFFSKLRQNFVFRLPIVAIGILALLLCLKYFNFYKAVSETTTNFWATKFGLTNRQYFNIVFSHLKYYHSFLWRQYPHITFLAFLGVILGLLKNSRLISLFLVIFIVHFSFVIFRVFPQFVRYVYLVFPLFLLLAAYFLVWIADSLGNFKNRSLGNLFIFIFALFLVLNGNKFTFLPKAFYSLNFDMSEIPEVDFKSTYQLVKNKIDLSKEKVVVVDNRTDAAEWYLGEGKPDYYLVGPEELEPAWNLKRAVKKDPVSGALYLNNLEDFQKAVSNHKKGFVVLEERAIDYVNLDRRIIDYIKNNLKREARLEHLPGNNLSIWPIELYSWGLN